MATINFVWTGTLSLVKITPVIKALFGCFNLGDSINPSGEIYIAKGKDDDTSWASVTEKLQEQCYDLGMDLPDFEISELLLALAGHCGIADLAELKALFADWDFDADADLGDLFEVAKRMDDGHGLSLIKMEGASYCARMIEGEFGGHSRFIGKHVDTGTQSSAGLVLGEKVESSLAAGNIEAAALAILSNALWHINDILDPQMRDQVKAKVSEQLAMSVSSVVPVKHWDAYANPDHPMGFGFEIEDNRRHNGQAILTIAAEGGRLEDMLSVTMEVNTDPATGSEVPAASVHFDDSGVAAYLYKIGDRILVRPESAVTLTPDTVNFHGINERVFWLE